MVLAAYLAEDGEEACGNRPGVFLRKVNESRCCLPQPFVNNA